MIRFVKKSDPQPAAEDAGEDCFEKVREAAADRHKKAANDSLRSRAPRAAEDDDRLIGNGVLESASRQAGCGQFG
ncbi:hypothetical protein HJB89_08745 [Rhizobium sp. NZLR8]|nr:hypothetical protein [Rhizobium sp. NZLR8]